MNNMVTLYMLEGIKDMGRELAQKEDYSFSKYISNLIKKEYENQNQHKQEQNDNQESN